MDAETSAMRIWQAIALSACVSAQLVEADAASPPITSPQQVTVDGLERTYLLHIPPQYDPEQPTPVVLAFHGALENAASIEDYSLLSQKADEEGFIVVYPSGLGIGPWCFWNVGTWHILFGTPPDEVKFVETILDDLPTLVNVDANRVFATGYSLGGMLCYRLADKMPDRIAAIAAIAGSVTIPDPVTDDPMPVLHFHGTADPVIPYNGMTNLVALLLTFESVAETIATWTGIDHCDLTPTITPIPDQYHDGTTVEVWEYAAGLDDTEVTLFKINGGGHTWPGNEPYWTLYGISTREVNANDLMWDFFQRHPLD